MLKSNPSYLGIAGKNPALGPPKSALGLRPWADFGGPRAGFFPEFLGQGLDFLPKYPPCNIVFRVVCHYQKMFLPISYDVVFDSKLRRAVICSIV